MGVEVAPHQVEPLAPYLKLFRDFVDGRIDGPTFEQRYLASYLADPTLWDPPLFDVLDTVFADVDDYMPSADRRGPKVGLDDADLRRSVAHALHALQA